MPHDTTLGAITETIERFGVLGYRSRQVNHVETRSLEDLARMLGVDPPKPVTDSVAGALTGAGVPTVLYGLPIVTVPDMDPNTVVLIDVHGRPTAMFTIPPRSETP